MPHFGGACIGTLGHERDSENLLAVVTDHLEGIVVHILDLIFFFPEEFGTFGAFSHEHRHIRTPVSAGMSRLSVIYPVTICQRMMGTV